MAMETGKSSQLSVMREVQLSKSFTEHIPAYAQQLANINRHPFKLENHIAARKKEKRR